MENPIPARARGWIYVAGLIVAAACLIAAAVLTVLGLDAWQPVVTVVSSAITGLCAILARANLDADPGEMVTIEGEDAV